MAIKREYFDIARYDLKAELISLKKEIHQYTEEGVRDRAIKVELIIEELMTNSFNYLLPSDSEVNLCIRVSDDLSRIKYTEHPVTELDVNKIVNNAKEVTREAPLDEVGGLGLLLVESFSDDIDCRYDTETLTRTFILNIS
ncbi:ATP-binding protein [Dongshaea marina]|uniref:ATP-binding protein n=1 Tax=Dongshaea marina TaxID=2047966 RepID=UPI000D3E1546|nr:ATP-binding protein [Dongshaea marina]